MYIFQKLQEENLEEAEEEDSSPATYVPPQTESRISSNQDDGDDERTERYSAPRPETDKNDQRNWTTYGQDSFSGSQQSIGGEGSGGRYGSRGGRYNDNKFSSNLHRDNRRDRRDNYRDGGERRSDRYFQKRGSDDYAGGGGSNSFPSKWNHNNRDGGGGGGSFRNRNNDYGGSRRHDRDNGGAFGSFRDKNDSRPNSYKSFGSSNHSRSHDSGSEYRGHSRNNDERRTYFNERLNDGEENARESTAAHAQPPLPTEPIDSRLNESPDYEDKPLENGQENGIAEGEANVRESSENLAIDASSDNAFKTRKKHKKKKNVDSEDTVTNKRDSKPTDVDRKPRNQKEDRKTPGKNFEG